MVDPSFSIILAHEEVTEPSHRPWFHPALQLVNEVHEATSKMIVEQGGSGDNQLYCPMSNTLLHLQVDEGMII
jgi:hypothetical protein